MWNSRKLLHRTAASRAICGAEKDGKICVGEPGHVDRDLAHEAEDGSLWD